MVERADGARRNPLSRDRILRTAIALANQSGIDSVSMRNLAQELGVVPMALYKHVANKDELLDGMIDVVVSAIDPPGEGLDWSTAVRRRILSARQALLGHPWASRVIESRTTPTPAVLAYMDSMIGMLLSGGLSVDLTHHVMHALGSRLLGFSQELFAPPAAVDPDASAATARALAGTYPHLAKVAARADHDEQSAVGSRCDDQFEFEFTLDLLLDGIEALRLQQWSSRPAR
ncbi:TetR/AcrR family transcriptional regulator [Actinoplanes xinjiangensis]|uniref:TetR family transcriptional regulator n=1 Tax=Actinoplanes xinjiangensis TaxID=512350 RepID=A0A316EDL7_9ACTN|nr:TetR/AcrR family transcriptional regulator [Actinoplanes xinjiangensis]PWK27746.1 TetR family transcriptional regulator [Actinoplanes xinjiangensis]GIF45169.1 TetR family transcriptional regulator [Actinoplanes xinjiangensis]